MGVGIAVALALAGVPTTVVLRRAEAVTETARRVAARLDDHRRLGLVREDDVGPARALIETRLGLAAGPYDVIVESVAEDLGAKRALLARAEAFAGAGGVLCSNTSSLSVSELAGDLEDQGRVAGWHWFHPADLMELVEVVPGARTAAATLDRLAEWSRSLGKTPVVLARDTPGFVGNRLQSALLREAYALVADGVCAVEDVDAAVTAGLGPRWSAVGPFASADLAGLAVHATVVRELFPTLARDRDVPLLLERTIRDGASGAEHGAGLRGAYRPDEAAALVEKRDQALAARLRARRRQPS
jgi:3-hydroxybutyryl-CoA dehydrogenase